MIKGNLASGAHTVDIASDGADGSFLARSYEYDVIVLDYSLPKKNGLVVCKEIRVAGKSTPVIFLSTTDDGATKLAAFDSGADDYMTKPFSLLELSARIQAVRRRPAGIQQKTLSVGGLTLDSDKYLVTRDNESIRLTRKEFNLLEYFMRNPGTILSRALILEHVWTADSDPFSNTVEAHVRNLRKKINISGKLDMLANIPGRGYVMDVPERLQVMLGS